MTRSALLALVLSAGAGCVDAGKAFDDFGDRVVDAREGEIDAPIVSNLPNFTGEFYGVARANFKEDRFLKFIMTYEFTAITENTGEVDWTAQALHKVTLEPVGDPFTANDVPVGADATADIPMIGTLDGRANTVSGSTLAIDAVVHMTVVNADFTCGNLTGTAGGGPLEGTTYGAVRLTAPVTDTTPFIVRCEDGPQP